MPPLLNLSPRPPAVGRRARIAPSRPRARPRLPVPRAAGEGEPDPSPSPATLDCYGSGVEATCVIRGDEDDDEGGEGGATAPPADDPPSSSPLSLPALALLISPFFFWGSSMTAMKLLEPHTTPLFVASVRLIPAGAALVAWADAQGRPRPSSAAAWRAIAVFALIDGAAFQGFLAEGLRRTSAGLGSVIIDSQPLTVAALSALLYGESLSPAGVVGLGLGVAGLCLLEVPPGVLAGVVPALGPVLGVGQAGGAADAAAAAAALSPAFPAAADAAATAAAAAAPWSLWDSGEWWMLCAAQAMAVGTVLVPWVSRYVDPVQATGWHLLLGGLPLAVLAGVREGPELVARLQDLTPADVALLGYVSLLGSAASYGVFFYNASRGSLTKLSALTFLTPAFAAGTGFVVLGERLGPLQWAGALVTLGAVGLISGAGKAREKEA